MILDFCPSWSKTREIDSVIDPKNKMMQMQIQNSIVCDKERRKTGSVEYNI